MIFRTYTYVAFLFSFNIDLHKLQKNLHVRLVETSGGNKIPTLEKYQNTVKIHSDTNGRKL